MNLFALISAATLTIYIPSSYRTITGGIRESVNTCTAVAISPDTFLTAQHCIEDITGPIIIKHHPKIKVLLIKQDKERDLALCKVKGLTLHNRPLGQEPFVTDVVYTVHSGEGLEGTYSEGVIQNICKDDPDDVRVHIRDSILIVQGASGSGLFNKRAELIGLNVIKDETGSLAVDLETIKHFLK